MDNELKLHRHAAAEAGRAFLAQELSFEEFMRRFADSEDDLVSDLVDLIVHEPQRGGVLGVSEEVWAQYQSQVKSAIVALDSE